MTAKKYVYDFAEGGAQLLQDSELMDNCGLEAI